MLNKKWFFKLNTTSTKTYQKRGEQGQNQSACTPSKTDATVQHPEPAPAEAKVQLDPAQLWEDCKDLAQSKDILARLVEDLTTHGLVGEERIARLLYLALSSRWTQRPLSIAVKGQSSGGKSETTKRVLSFVPDEAYHALTAMSERALAYSKVDYRHRFLVLYEAPGMGNEMASYLIRSLLSEGRINYEVTDIEHQCTKHITKEGPTGLITTTTAASLHPENETRMISVEIDDSPEQTARIMKALATKCRITPCDLRPWHSFHRWLETTEKAVSIPYYEALVSLIPSDRTQNAAGLHLDSKGDRITCIHSPKEPTTHARRRDPCGD
jgi:hypothetical protein